MPTPVTRAFVVTHTHWDREWYRDRSTFQVQLIEVIRQVLDALESGTLKHFLLDGQVILLEDYLQVHPEDTVRVRGHIESGALAVGPWFVLADEFLVGEESLVRNLLLGKLVADSLGGTQQVGYMPDSFGHVAQLPQILSHAGFESFVYTRGNGSFIDDTGCEYWWQSPDGTRVLAVHQTEGYINAGHLGHEQPEHAGTPRILNVEHGCDRLSELIDVIATVSNTGIALLSNGYDHLPPQRQLPEIVDSLGKARPDIDVRIGTLEEFIAAVRESLTAGRVHQGELRHGRDHFVLSGVWSTRTYLKQANEACEVLLSALTEPALAYGHFMHGLDYPAVQLHRSWKRLLENHPHDSICGCSTDAVHREMLVRFDDVRSTASELLASCLRQLTPTLARTPEGDQEVVITVVNASPRPRTGVIERVITLPADHGPWHLVDDDGRAIPVHVRERIQQRRVWAPDTREQLLFEDQRETLEPYRNEFPADEDTPAVEYWVVEFRAKNIPGVSHRSYRLRKGSGKEVAGGVMTTEDSVENGLLWVRLRENGMIDVRHQGSGVRYEGLNLLEYTEDRGDTYDYNPPEDTESKTAKDCRGRVRIEHSSPLVATLRAEFDMEFPGGATCPVLVRVGLADGASHVEIDVTMDNQAKDYRLRVQFPTGLVTDVIGSSSPFLALERPIHEHSSADWAQEALPTRPQAGYSWLSDGNHGLALFSRGLPEIEGTSSAQGTGMALTLLRCVEWISRHDVASRRYANAGPTYHVPEAQCSGLQRFRYAVMPFSGDACEADLEGTSRAWRAPFAAWQGVVNGHVPGTSGLIECESHDVSISAVKKHETRDSLVVRLYNVRGGAVTATLRVGFDVGEAWRVDLHEERIESLASNGTELVIELRSHEIRTIEIVPGTDV